MVMTNAGFNGTVDAGQWARMMYAGAAAGFENDTAWLVFPGTGRQVRTAAQNGGAFAAGVYSRETAQLTNAIPTPTTGGWYLVVRAIDWSAGGTSTGVSVQVMTGPTVGSITLPAGGRPVVNSTTVPGFVQNPGTLYHQPLAWVFANSNNTTIDVIDLRVPAFHTLAENLFRPPSLTASRTYSDPTTGAGWEAKTFGTNFIQRNIGGFTFDGTGKILTVPRPGIYAMSGQIEFASSTAGNARAVQFRTDGGQQLGSSVFRFTPGSGSTIVSTATVGIIASTVQLEGLAGAVGVNLLSGSMLIQYLAPVNV